MDILATLVDVILHFDQSLAAFVADHGAWVYVLLFAIVFAETGLIVLPFLPGDFLLFVVGTLCGAGVMSLPLSLATLLAAAVLGNQSAYAIGRQVGSRAFGWRQSRCFNRAAFDRTHAYYERHGGPTLVAARFLPYLRTFAPFVAGVAHMTRSRFTAYDVTGAVLWVGLIVPAGYLFGNLPWVKDNLDRIIAAAILVPFVLLVLSTLRGRRTPAVAGAAPARRS